MIPNEYRAPLAVLIAAAEFAAGMISHNVEIEAATIRVICDAGGPDAIESAAAHIIDALEPVQ